MKIGTFLQGLSEDDTSPFRDLQEEARRKTASVSSSRAAQSNMRELRHQVERLSLLNQALWELLRERLQLNEADLQRIAHDIDMRDGIADGKISASPVRCPTCSRVSNSKHYKCLYCGQLFEKPMFG